jgi:hypothetical protein
MRVSELHRVSAHPRPFDDMALGLQSLVDRAGALLVRYGNAARSEPTTETVVELLLGVVAIRAHLASLLARATTSHAPMLPNAAIEGSLLR